MSRLYLPCLRKDKEMEGKSKWSYSRGGELVKDGWKINVGDCALFEAKNAPPFIGMVQSFSVDTEGHTKLSVNWLYRPLDIKLGKGVLLEAAPNEIFYSFHKDEIAAKFLLHPCKVAFLCKGVELPSGISSFVCRRVYDRANKCLWWLTDQEHYNEHQEEVDKLLSRRRPDMQEATHTGGQSPKALNVHGPSQQLKFSSEKLQNGSFFSQEKSKKRECIDQNIDPANRECSSKAVDSHAGHFKQGRAVRPVEIANVTDKYGGLQNPAGVEHLIHLMQEHVDDSAKKGTDLTSWRTMLVEVIANTNRDDCLNQFVQLGGLLIMDDWLQVAHKGKNGGGGSPKEGDTIDNELLLMLLHAFNKLPVDLNALKKSSVGKSVNLLRSHRNPEIKRRAKHLVDTWKKRVAAELNKSDTISGSSQGVSCPCNQAFDEEVYLPCNKGGRSAKVVLKASSPLSAKVNENTSGLSEAGVMETSSSPRSVEESSLHSSIYGYKDCHCKETVISDTTDVLIPSTKDEKSSSSSQSQNNSPSCSSCLGKASGSSCREDSKSSVAVSLSTKALSLLFHHSTSSKDITGSAMPVKQNESVVWRSLECEAKLHSGVTYEKGVDAAHRVTSRFPNMGDSLGYDLPGKHNVDNESLSNVSLQIDTKSKKSTGNEAGATQNDDGYRSFSPNHVDECIKNVQAAGNLMQTLEKDQPSASGLCEQIDPAEGLAEVETLISGAQGRIIATSMKYSRHSESSKLDMDKSSEKPLSCPTASKILKAVEGPPTSDTEITSLGIGENKLDQKTKSGCYSDVSSFHPDDSGNESILDTKESKDGIVCRDSSFTACNDLSLYSSMPGVASQQKDALDLSALVRVTVSDTGGPSDSLMINPPSTDFHPERTSDSCRMDVGSLYQDAEKSEAVFAGSNGKLHATTKAEISGALRQLDSTKSISGHDVSDNKGWPGLHKDTVTMGEDNKQDVILEDITKDGDTADKKTISKEHVVSTNTSDSDINNSTEVTRGSAEELSKVVVQVATKADIDMELCSVQSDKKCLDVSTPHSLKNEHLKDTNIVHFRKQCSSGIELEDEEKDERSGSQDVLDGIENMARKKKCLECEKTGGSGEHKQVEQAAYVSVSDKSKLVGTELNPDSLFHREERSSAIQESEDSAFPRKFVINAGVQTDGAVSILSSTHQAVKCLARTADVTELSASECHATDIMMGMKRTSIDIGVPLRTEFDLNEGLALDEANQDELAIYATASASLTTSGGLATKRLFFPPFNLVETKEQVGWKSSASRSDFQHNEPQATSDLQHPIFQNALCDAVNNVAEKPRHNFLDIDLNVADKRVMEDVGMISYKLCTQQSPFMKASEQMTESGQEFMVSTSGRSAFSGPSGSAGKFPFDLNCVSQSEEDGLAITQLGHCINYLGSSVKAVSKGSLYGSSHISRDFDLNDGPCFEDAVNVSMPQCLNVRSNDGIYFQPVIGMRVNENLVNGSPWTPVGNTFPVFVTPLSSSARTDPQACPVDAAEAVKSISISTSVPTSSANLYNGEPTVATSHAAAYSKSTVAPFLAAGLSLGSSNPFSFTPLPGGMASFSDSPGVACFPTDPSQSLSAGATSPSFRPSINLMEPSGMLTMPCLDLNTGPDTVMESREEIVDPRNAYTRELHISLEHKAFHQGGASVLPLKRKEPEDGWDSHKTGHKQATW